MRSLVVFVTTVTVGLATALLFGTVWLLAALAAGLVLSLVLAEIERRARHDGQVAAEGTELLRMHGTVPTLLFADDGRLLAGADTVAGQLGWAPDEFASLRFDELVHGDDVATVLDAFSAVRDLPWAQATVPLRLRSANDWQATDLTVTNACDVPGVDGYVARLSPAERAMDSARAAERMSRAVHDIADLVDQASDGMSETTLTQTLASRVRHSMGVDSVEIYRAGDDGPELAAGVGPGNIALDRRRSGPQTRELAGGAMSSQQTQRDSDGTNHQVAVPVKNSARRATGALVLRWSGDAQRLDGPAMAHLRAMAGILGLIRRQRAAEHEAFGRARRDEVTGLVNRETFLERLRRSVEAITTDGADVELVAVLLLDLDHFKIVNDSLGHTAGDVLLEEVGARLSEGLRPGDTLARFGGDEFVVLMRNIASADRAVMGARRMQRSLEEAFRVSGHTVQVRASIGVASTADPEADPGVLLQEADAALSSAKEAGRERIEVFDPAMFEAAVTRLRTEEELRSALQGDQLRVFYQPMVDLGTGVTAGAEALVRWVHPGRGLVAPAEFIPISEATGLIAEIGAWVIEEACGQAATWRDAGTPMRVSVNIAARQLDDPDLLTAIDRALERHGLAPELLAVEVSEAVVLTDSLATVETLHGLHARGVGVAIDDFGTGSSSLSFLKNLPVDTVKIDRDFVSGIDKSGDDYEIVSAMIKLVQTLGKRVVAEGVETEQQLELLKDLGCDWAQGFLFSPAVYDLEHGTEDRPWTELVLDSRR